MKTLREQRKEAFERMRDWLNANPQFVHNTPTWDLSKGSNYTAYDYGHRPGETMKDDKTIDGTCTEIPDPLPQLEDKS